MLQVNQKINTQKAQFTVTEYKRVLKAYLNGYYRDIINMMKQSAFDSHVSGCLRGRRAGFQRDFSIAPYSEDERDIERAQFIETVVKTLNVRRLFKRVHEAILYKYSVIDFTWEVIDGKQVPTQFKFFDQKYFRYDKDVLKIDFGNQLKEIPPEVLVCEFDGDVPDMFPVLRDYILKNFGVASWASFIETFGEAIIIGKYPPGADDEVKTALETAVNNIARSSRGIMPETTEIEMIETKRNTGDHEKFIEAANKGISISLLGHANAVEQSKGLQVGENLTSYKVKQEIAIDDLYFIDEQMQKLVRMIHERNFGDGRIPRFETNKNGPINVEQHRKNLETAFDHGLKINPAEYKKLGLYVYEDQEPLQKDMTQPF